VIVAAIHGQGYCWSAGRAMSLLMGNALSLGAVMATAYLLLFFGRLFVTAAATAIVWAILSYNPSESPEVLALHAEERSAAERGGNNLNAFKDTDLYVLPEKWLKLGPESGRDWLVCSKFARRQRQPSCGPSSHPSPRRSWRCTPRRGLLPSEEGTYIYIYIDR